MEDDIVVVAVPASGRHQFAKVIIGTTAGFFAGKVTEKVYDAVVKIVRSRNASA